ncbi:lysozyme inhibitor LprI family protein [Desulfonatronum thiodismutans]|uniref:lysozyme inhibitor LprI family protein n=1 Tax=Desulfonatronum thiodismutans TaxID=159290 RepID=UPI0005503AC4|nr:lysozyme inhibitor LprI family protein [Desulfonatronum thiodismutans]
MPTIILTLLVLINLAMPSAAQTQMEMNLDACEAFKAAYESLDATYQRILVEYQDEKAFLVKFKAAQESWMIFRDAHLAALYPEEDTQMAYGSIFPLCRCQALLEMTEQRIQVLEKWIDGVEEGDVCVGSIRYR